MFPNQNEPHIQDYIQVIMRRRWIILTFFIVLVVTVLIGSLKQTPIYRATATLMIERRSPKVVSVEEVTPMGTSDYYAYKDYYETQYKLIKSRSLLEKVADSLGLKPADTSGGKDPVDKLLKTVNVYPVKNSQLVEISVENSNPRMAANIANTVADEYINQNLERNINAATDAAEWLTKRIDEQRQKLKGAELALQEYRGRHSIDVLPQITNDERAIEDVKAEYARLQGVLANYTERYTVEHPKMIELKAQINSLGNKVHGLEDVDAGDEATEYRALEGEVQTNRRMYELLLARLKEIDVSSTLNVNNISIIDRAEVPEKPVKPRLLLNMVLAVMVGLVMGTGLGFFVDYLDTTIKSPQDVKGILQSYFLGGIPEIEEKEDVKKDRIVHLEPKSPISEAYRDIRTEILFLTLKDKNSKTILVTSAEPQAGKTTTTTNTGIAFAQNGNKVLIVDSDLRKPQMHKAFGLDKDHGLSDYLRGDTVLDSIIKNTDIENLQVITAGKTLSNPSEVIDSARMREFISDVKQKFDLVLFDSPPVISVTDAIILANMVDASIQVVRSGKAHVPVTLRAKEKLASAKANVLGVVLNDINTFQGDYYYHYYKYYRYYGKDDKSKRAEKKETSLKDKLKNLVKRV